MIRKIISAIGIIGVMAVIAISIIDHIVFLDDKPYFIAMGIGFILFVPMLVRELLLFKKKKEQVK